MKITFLSPGYSPKPTGGVKVVYEYANRLVDRGHEVTVVHHALQSAKNTRYLFDRLYLRLTGKSRQCSKSLLVSEVTWFSIDSRVKLFYVPEATAHYIPDGDAILINRWVSKDLSREKGKQFLLMLHYGVFPDVKDREDALFRAPIGKIVIARWLYEQGLKLGVPADEMIHNPIGIDHSKYRIIHPTEERPPRVATLYSQIAWKGSEDGLKALELTREELPTLQAIIYSHFHRPDSLPDWIEFYCDPSQEEFVSSIYNGSSIYLCSSWSEGWHLPPAEAMACGCAVVSTDIGGVRDYAEHGVTALLSPPKDPEALAANLLRLLQDDELRIRLAKAGHERIQEFTWERSTDLLEQFLTDRV